MSVTFTEVSSFGDMLLKAIKEVAEDDRVNYIIREMLHEVTVNDAGDRLIHYAAKSGEIQVTKLLIEAGSDLNALNNEHKSPIMLAIENKADGCLQVIEILCKAMAQNYIVDKLGEDRNVQFIQDYSQFSSDCLLKFYCNVLYSESMSNTDIVAQTLIIFGYCFCQAARLQNSAIIEYLIDCGFWLNKCDCDKPYLTLSRAVEMMNLELVKILIERGDDVDLKDHRGRLPIAHYGCPIPNDIQEPEIIKLLLSKSNTLKDIYQEGIIYQLKSAFERGNKQVIQMLIEHHDDILNVKDDEGETPVHYLARNYNSGVTDVLQDRKIYTNVTDVFGRTPLFTATRHYCTPIDTFKFFLENGADVNYPVTVLFEFDFQIEVPLFSLCNNNSIKRDKYLRIIEMFLQHGLNVQYVGSNGTTVFNIITADESYYKAEPLIAHLAVIEESGKPIVKCIRKKIETHKNFRKCFDVCKVELLQMKNCIVNENLSLYMIIVNEMSERQVLKRCRFNSNSLSRFHELKEQFQPTNQYYSIIQKYISSIILRLELLQKASLILCKIFNYICDPYHIAVIEIVDYLSNQDLESLVASGL